MSLDCNEIIPGRLWVGAFVQPHEVGLLRQIGITTVVSLQSPEDLSFCGISENAIIEALAASAIDFRRAPVRDFDRQALADRLPHCVGQLENALAGEGTRVYLHCTAGINRSPTVAAALLMRTQGMTAKEACDYVRARRHCSPYLAVLEGFASPPTRNPANLHQGS